MYWTSDYVVSDLLLKLKKSELTVAVDRYFQSKYRQAPVPFPSCRLQTHLNKQAWFRKKSNYYTIIIMCCLFQYQRQYM